MTPRPRSAEKRFQAAVGAGLALSVMALAAVLCEAVSGVQSFF